MADEIDQDQEFNEQRLKDLIEKNRFKPGATSSLTHCRLCGEPIPEQRQKILSGVTTCIDCQERIERKR